MDSAAASAVPKPRLQDCDAMAYNAVGVLVKYSNADRYTCEIYRSTKKVGGYKKIGTIKTSGVTWYTSNDLPIPWIPKGGRPVSGPGMSLFT